ncbi:hypothetical protein HMJ29_16260 [Hymenobacter taeanensis]|uniref:Uncharacterized protein n=1 Tax=Hymenobacter taeanensis TaxID=2735321 RepID=A0A6M6BK06_9BACT|nr:MULTISPECIES: hypothetical protein [Hymenobacter]QJX48390.1 hypothetical protein HMJ29_16260 [Hymenobacter taeanensis]UOQ82116.1 hypothetical protein MUN83_04885 [Hymenobacter sp. 5414T-23]
MNIVNNTTSLRFLSFGLGATLLLSSSCTIFKSDLDSSNPVVAAQAQRVSDLRNQISDQQRVVNTEKAKLKSLEYQLKSAQQELKARKL